MLSDIPLLSSAIFHMYAASSSFSLHATSLSVSIFRILLRNAQLTVRYKLNYECFPAGRDGMAPDSSLQNADLNPSFHIDYHRSFYLFLNYKWNPQTKRISKKSFNSFKIANKSLLQIFLGIT